MRKRQHSIWRRCIAYLRAKRVIQWSVEKRYHAVGSVRIEHRRCRDDLSDLDPAERAAWARFNEMIESGAKQQLLQEPNLSRFRELARKVKHVDEEETSTR